MTIKHISLNAQPDGSTLVFNLGENTLFPKSWYDLEIHLSENQPSCVNGFMDFGDGLLSCSPFVLYKEEDDFYRARLFIDEMPKAVVFSDFSDTALSTKLDLKKCSKVKIYGALAYRALKTFFENPAANTPRLIRNITHFVKDKSFTQIRPSGLTNESAYQAWIDKYDFKAEDRAEVEETVQALRLNPKISVIIPAYKTKLEILKETLGSLQSQIYQNWEACICIDGELEPSVRAYLEALTQSDPRVLLTSNETSMGIAGATNQAFSLATGAWTGFLDHDDLLRPHSLATFVEVIENNPDVKIIYSDEDKVDDEGKRFDPYFKCGFSDELILSMNYFNHLTMIETNEIRKAGIWNSDLDGAQDYDMVLRVISNIARDAIFHIPKILYHWRASQYSEALTRDIKQNANFAGAKAVENYLNREDISASVTICAHSGYNRVTLPKTHGEAAKISIIIPTRNQKNLLERCVTSIFENTTYPNFEIIIIDNESDDDATKKYMADVSQNEAITVLNYDKPFNYSAINNFAVEHAAGDIICLLNNDTKVLTSGWLSEMQAWLNREGVGCVGAKLLYPNQTVQHGGVILGIGGIAGHSHKYFPTSELGYYGRLSVVQNFSAVTAACMMFKKTDFLKVGGLNAEDLAVSYNDVDLCLKFLSAGLRTVWTPYVELIHYESMSRGKGVSDEKRVQWSNEARYMRLTWESLLEEDPYYSPNLTRLREDFSFKL